MYADHAARAALRSGRAATGNDVAALGAVEHEIRASAAIAAKVLIVNQYAACKVVVISSNRQVEHTSADLAIQVRFGYFYRRDFPRTETEKFVAF